MDPLSRGTNARVENMKRRWQKIRAFFLVAYWSIKGNDDHLRLREERENEEKQGQGLSFDEYHGLDFWRA